MNTISASEIKRRGVITIEEHLKNGPVHIIKNNKPQYVVLSEEDYQKLTAKLATVSQKPAGLSMMLQKSATGALSRHAIDEAIQAERKSWSE